MGVAAQTASAINAGIAPRNFHRSTFRNTPPHNRDNGDNDCWQIAELGQIRARR